MRRGNPKREHGAALLALLAVIMLGASWLLVSQLNAETGGISAVNRARNAAVLNRAKTALIGYVAIKAAESGERNPGRLPCPEGASYVGIPANEGIAWNGFGTDCVSVGRLPWRTLGIEKLLDASSEPLWYVVGPAWRLSSSTSTLVINSNTTGDSSVDGQSVIALIIAPGPAMNVQAATGCAAKSQARSAPSSSIDATNYLECFDAATRQFTTTASSSSYNDQVVRITVADIMPAIEAAIAGRIEREILPALQTVFTPATWGFSGTNPVLPFAAPFASPGSGAGTSNYQGASATYAGLLPFHQTENCTVSASDPRCTTALSFLSFAKGANDVMTSGSGSIRTQSACSTQVNHFVCLGEYLQPSIAVTVHIKIANVAMGLRTRKSNPFVWEVTFEAMNDTTGGWGTMAIPHTVTDNGLQADGSWLLTIAGTTLPDIATAGWGTYANYRVTVKQSDIGDKFGDHALLSKTDATTGWFASNEWYRLVYYALSPSNSSLKVATERSCTATPADCLSLTNVTSSSSKSALLALAGRSVNGIARPSATLADYFEFGNAKGAFENQSVSPASAMIYSDTGAANAYTIAVASLATGASLQFRATNANTGASTLNTAATGTRSLVNMDGTSLAAATIQANAAIQVTWDGTQFLVSKRPFNDRVVAIGSN